MTCPLSALATIATLTSSPIPSPPASSPTPPLAREVVPNAPARRMPMKKRSFPDLERAGHDEEGSAECGTDPQMNVKPSKPNKKNRRARPAKKAKKSRRAASPCQQQAASDAPSFPAILMGILSAPQNSGCIAFLSDDRSFVVIDPVSLAEKVLPAHFEGEVPSYQEFLGLLEAWGFEATKDARYPEVSVYSHRDFSRGDWEACLKMRLPGAASPAMSSVQSSRSPAASPETYPAKARSVTPPEMYPYQAEHLSQLELPAALVASSAALGGMRMKRSLSQEAASQWMAQSAALEQMILATAETRRRLSGMRAQAQLDQANGLDDSNHSLPSLPPRVSLVHDLQGAKGLSDAQVSWMTSNVVSAAMAALHGSNQASNQSQAQGNDPLNSSNHSTSSPISASPSNSSLDAMTEAFLERSNARRMRSRPAGIFGGASSAPRYSDLVDARTRALLAGGR